MARSRDQVRSELASLLEEGRALYKKEGLEEATHKTGGFAMTYHRWYSRALPVVRQLVPERFDEFQSYFRDPRRKEMTLSNYGVQDYIAGLTKSYQAEPIHWKNAALNGLLAQVAIVQSAEDRFDSILGSIEDVLRAELLDDEIAVAQDLVAKNHLRASGAVAGVVLETHLARVADAHGIKLRKKHPTIGDLNNPLKNGGVIDTPEWRRIQRLADLRNLCVHRGPRDPSKEEVEELIAGTERTIKTVV
jgi:hypothetical protein